MTDSKTYFTSPDKTSTTKPTTPLVTAVSALAAETADSEVEEPTQENVDNVCAEQQQNAMPCVIRRPAPNSKLILQNMEEVLDNVKKQHRQKHRRKKEQKKLAAQMEAAAAAAATKTTAREPSHKSDRKEKKHAKKPLQEKAMQENDLIQSSKAKRRESRESRETNPQKSLNAKNNILKHFQRSPKKDDSVTGNDDTEDVVFVKQQSTKGAASESRSVKATNAFEVMMNARNKSIGSNTPGKEVSTASTPEDDEAASSNAKRKLLLQEWSDKKGGTKRKLDEEARAAFVEEKLEQRAKKFKQMLVHNATASSKNDNKTVRKEKSVNRKENGSRRKTKKAAAAATTTSEVAEIEAPARGKARARTRRLSSMESVKSESPEKIIYDIETEDFLSKLSSPTKKRDSLLGYFSKKPSPKELAEKDKPAKTINANKATLALEDSPVETPKRRSRRSKVKSSLSITGETNDSIVAPADTVATATTTPLTTNSKMQQHTTLSTGRPQRSCAGKARYDYDLEESPAKQQEKIMLSSNAHTKEGNVSIEIINLEDSNTELPSTPILCSPRATPRKLAPLFMRSMPKPAPDPCRVKARHDFLMSGVPDKIRLEQAKHKQYEQSYEEGVEIFPKLTHVQQWSASDLEFLQQHKVSNFKLHKATDETVSLISSRRVAKAKLGSMAGITQCTLRDFRLTHKTILQQQHMEKMSNSLMALTSLENKRAIVKAWKLQFENFPTYKCYNQLREKYRYFSVIDSAQDTQQVSESLVVTRHTRRSLEAAGEDKPPAAAPNGELLFTEKYKPMLYEQVLVNLIPVTQLRDFLANWAGGSARNSQNPDDSMDFINDSNSSQQLTCNTVVILGPSSSGKTSAVYALANEMNFNVLEINAGMKRTGKKLIQELQEATQSHQIRKESLPSTTAALGKAQKNLLKLSLSSLKTRKQSSQTASEAAIESASFGVGDSSNNSNLELNQNSTRKSLILIEDADIVFDQTDAGFIEAIYSLAASSKRPVIVVAQEPNCAHLQRLILQNSINFTQPNVLNISRYLAVLSLMENCPIMLDDLVSLYLYNGKNLRKTLMELQIFIQSGGDRVAPKSASKQQPEESNKHKDAQFYASPSKRRFSTEPSASINSESAKQDEQAACKNENNIAKELVYTHRTLFEFYTMGQNDKFRIPFPVDFQLLHVNIKEILNNAKKLQLTNSENSVNTTTCLKRKSCSPKKAWLNSMTSTSTYAATPLAAICDFYENISIAANISCTHDVQNYGQADRLIPQMNEHIAHDLVERAIAVNLAASECPYNLFLDAQNKDSLCDHLGAATLLRTQRARYLDFEPTLRNICRSEKQRSAQERRSTRFYHYLRNSTAHMSNFSMEPFTKVCHILQETAQQNGENCK